MNIQRCDYICKTEYMNVSTCRPDTLWQREWGEWASLGLFRCFHLMVYQCSLVFLKDDGKVQHIRISGLSTKATALGLIPWHDLFRHWYAI